MTYDRWQATIVDDAGNIQVSAEVEVFDATTGLNATLYADRAGAAGKSNPFNADSVTAFAFFYAAAGRYNITATLGDGSTVTWTDVLLGTAKGYDADDTLFAYDISYSFAGELADGEALPRVNIVRSVILPASLTGSVATCEVAPTGSISLSIMRYRSDDEVEEEIGTVDFAAGETSGTFTFASEVEFLAGDQLWLVGPSTADATFSDPSVTIAGTR